MSIQQQVLLRHRSEGHLRFSIPAVLCAPEAGERIVSGLRSMEGVYRVDLYARQGKLSIRYLETVCDFAGVLRRLHALLQELAAAVETGGRAAAAGRQVMAASLPLRRRLAESRAARWLRARLQDLRETAMAMGILARRGLRTAGSALSQRPRWVTEFLNDLLMLYLIKIHWQHILHLWLPNPWRYRYEWAATFYLIYLSVQSRLPQRA